MFKSRSSFILLGYFAANHCFAGPLTDEMKTKYALAELADVAVANTRCKIHVPETHFKTVLGLNRMGWTDESDANIAVMMAYEAGKSAYDAMSKREQKAKCAKISSWYRDLEASEAARAGH